MIQEKNLTGNAISMKSQATNIMKVELSYGYFIGKFMEF